MGHAVGVERDRLVDESMTVCVVGSTPARRPPAVPPRVQRREERPHRARTAGPATGRRAADAAPHATEEAWPRAVSRSAWRRRLIAAWASRVSCCSRSAWRLSYSFLPRASAISTLARPSTKYRRERARSCGPWPGSRAPAPRSRGGAAAACACGAGRGWSRCPRCTRGCARPRARPHRRSTLREPVDQGRAPGPERLDLGPGQHDARLEGVLDVVVVPRLLVARDELASRLLGHGSRLRDACDASARHGRRADGPLAPRGAGVSRRGRADQGPRVHGAPLTYTSKCRWQAADVPCCPSSR